jgi:hypothetical protein
VLTKCGTRNAPLLLQRKIVYWLIHGHEWPIINTKFKVYKQFFPPDLGRHHVSPFLLSNSTVAEVHATQIPITAHRWAVASDDTEPALKVRIGQNGWEQTEATRNNKASVETDISHIQVRSTDLPIRP